MTVHDASATASDNPTLTGLEPEALWRHFEALDQARAALGARGAGDRAQSGLTVHAWLETAVIGPRVPGLGMVSIGPQIEAPHSPDERVSIPTVARFWRLLTGVVDELSAH